MVKRLHQERRNHERRCGAREQVEAGPQLAGPAFRGIVEVGLGVPAPSPEMMVVARPRRAVYAERE
jgi:hypothetical protein